MTPKEIHDHQQLTWKQATAGAYKPVPFDGDAEATEAQTSAQGVEATVQANELTTLDAEIFGDVQGDPPSSPLRLRDNGRFVKTSK